MSLELVTIPCLKDNYAFLLFDAVSKTAAVVDVPDAAPILAALDTRGWRLTDILITHHHSDHIDGVEELRTVTGARVTGAEADRARLPRLDWSLAEGDFVFLGAERGRVLEVPGHTVGHIAFHFPDSALAFTGDSLMAGGCGRLFEGTPDQMWSSLQKLAALPAKTRICSGHEYTAANLRFAALVDHGNVALQARIAKVAKARDEALPTVPSLLSGERATNPFLRPSDPAIRTYLGMESATDAEVFAELRSRKDRF